MIIIYKLDFQESKQIITFHVLQDLENKDIDAFTKEITMLTGKINSSQFMLVINLTGLGQVSNAAINALPVLVKLCNQIRFKKIIIVHEILRKEYLMFFLGNKAPTDNIYVVKTMKDAVNITG